MKQRTWWLVLLAALVCVSGSGGAVASPDVTPPATAFVTESGSVLVRSPLGSDLIQGTSTDDDSGISRVKLMAQPAACVALAGNQECAAVVVSEELSEVVWGPLDVELSCESDRKRCAWQAHGPRVPGSYLIHARAVDAAGNSEPDPLPYIFVAVV